MGFIEFPRPLCYIIRGYMENNLEWKKVVQPKIIANKKLYIFVWIVYQLIVYKVLSLILKFTDYKPNNVFVELVIVIIVFAFTTVIHEIVHIIFIWQRGCLKKIQLYFGLSFKSVPVIGIIYKGCISRKRKQIVLLAPFIMLTIIPVCLMLMLGVRNRILFNAVMLNACGCFNDIIIAITLFKYPKDSILYRSYWRQEAKEI